LVAIRTRSPRIESKRQSRRSARRDSPRRRIQTVGRARPAQDEIPAGAGAGSDRLGSFSTASFSSSVASSLSTFQSTWPDAFSIDQRMRREPGGT
jgi:hypothetical protein